jgi:hypothetical protein
MASSLGTSNERRGGMREQKSLAAENLLIGSQKFAFAFLLTAATVVLLSANLALREYFLGLSGTLVLSIVGLLAGLTLTFSHSLALGPRKFFFGDKWRISAFAVIGSITMISLVHLSLSPTWRGIQMLVVFLAFSLIIMALSVETGHLIRPEVLSFVLLAISVGAVSHIVAFVFEFDYFFGGRSRGETFLLGAAIIPLLTKNRWTGGLALATLILATILSDSRAATLTLIPVAAMVVFSLWNGRSTVSRLGVSFLASTAAGVLSYFLHNASGLRNSFAPPPITVQTTETVGPQIVVEDPLALNAWSFGRTRFWGELIAEMQSPTDWLLGKGVGFSSRLTREIWGLEHPHNEYLRFLVDTGALGLTLLLALGVILLSAVLSMRKEISNGRFWAAIALLFVLAVQSVITNTLIPPHFFLPMAVFFGLAIRQKL